MSKKVFRFEQPIKIFVKSNNPPHLSPSTASWIVWIFSLVSSSASVVRESFLSRCITKTAISHTEITRTHTRLILAGWGPHSARREEEEQEEASRENLARSRE